MTMAAPPPPSVRQQPSPQYPAYGQTTYPGYYPPAQPPAAQPQPAPQYYPPAAQGQQGQPAAQYYPPPAQPQQPPQGYAPAAQSPPPYGYYQPPQYQYPAPQYPGSPPPPAYYPGQQPGAPQAGQSTGMIAVALVGAVFGAIGMIMPSIGYLLFSIIPLELLVLGMIFGIIACVCGAVTRSGNPARGNRIISFGAAVVLINLICALILGIGLASIE
ncbi:MAG: hypothetical protein QW379_07895 [Thermoplasmata archaeon]